MEFVVGFIIFFLLIIVYYRAKNRFQEKHPKCCDFCGKMVPAPVALKDGHICYNCMSIRYGLGSVNLEDLIDKKHRNLSVMELKQYMNTLGQRGEEMKAFHPTRQSADGKISVDDNLGLFVMKAGTRYWAHRVCDVKRFKLVIERDWEDPVTENAMINGGHIAVYLNELQDELDLEVSIDTKLVGARHEVKKLLEDDLKFLEDMTGMRRG